MKLQILSRLIALLLFAVPCSGFFAYSENEAAKALETMDDQELRAFVEENYAPNPDMPHYMLAVTMLTMCVVPVELLAWIIRGAVRLVTPKPTENVFKELER